jgi:hypothetical protein
LDEAEDVGDLRAASSVHGRILDNLSLGAKLLGEIATHSVHVEQNLIITDQYLRLRQTLVKALRPFPDAARAVADCLRRVEVEVEQSPAPPLLGPNNADARP